MSLLQTLEIDTLKLRNLQFRNPDNSVIPSDMQLYAKGDGRTYWSTGVTSKQFTGLSTQVSINTANFNQYVSVASTTFAGDLSTLNYDLNSTLRGFSTFAINQSTFSTTVSFTNSTLAAYSTMDISTTAAKYQTIFSSNLVSTQINSSLISSNLYLTNFIQAVSTYGISTQIQLNNTSTFLTSTVYRGASTYTGSTFQGVYNQISSVNYGLQNLIFNNTFFLNTQINSVSTASGLNFQVISTYPANVASQVSSLSTSIGMNSLSTLVSANAFTSQLVSTVISTTTLEISASQALMEADLVSSVTGVNQNIVSVSRSLTSTINYNSTMTGRTISTMNGSISTLLTTGLVTNIYQTFLELEAYSASIVESTISTSGALVNSTIVNYTIILNSTLTYVSISSFNYLVANAYISSISTVIPNVLSTMSVVTSSLTVEFNSTISGNTYLFNSSISASINVFNTQISTLTSAAQITVSSYIGQGLSSQYGLYSTTLADASTVIGQATASTSGSLSTQFALQFFMAPSIIMNRTNAISTLTNVSTITGLSSIKIAMAYLDCTQYENFYILLSDIASDVCYGFTYSTNNQVQNNNKDITVYVDIQSTYKNNFYVMDMNNMSLWLNRPRIMNPNAYSLTTNIPSISVPTPNTKQQLFLSTYVGAYMLDFRIQQQKLWLRNIESYPYIYSKVTLTSFTLPQNVQVSQPLLQTSSFVYRGSLIPVSWTTNDLNIPLGFKFIGRDNAGRNTISWSGPYSSGAGSALVKVPTPPASFVRYDAMYVAIYPNNILNKETLNTNFDTPSGVLATQALPPLHVVATSLNSRIRVQNPGTVNQYLQVAEIKINNDARQNIITNFPFTYNKIISTSSYPFNGDVVGFGPQRVFDNNLDSYFFGGSNAVTLDSNAYVGADLSSFTSTFTSTMTVSSVEVYANAPGGLVNMQLRFENLNEPGIQNGLFFSTITLTGDYYQSYSYS